MNKLEPYGIDILRSAVKVLDYNNESFNQLFSAEELLKIVDINSQTGFDLFPDEWTSRQLEEALQGIVPQWREDEHGNLTPIYKTQTVEEACDTECIDHSCASEKVIQSTPYRQAGSLPRQKTVDVSDLVLCFRCNEHLTSFKDFQAGYCCDACFWNKRRNGVE